MENNAYRFYRPEWTVGRYNAEKHVAIMYNLIEGYSHFFESYSADVIGYVLAAGRNGEVKMSDIITGTGISSDSIAPFFDTLIRVGLLTKRLYSPEEIAKYREEISRKRMSGGPQETKNNLDSVMTVSTAEQRYFQTIESNSTIASVMFELTYNCNEKCIHCYNPGATRNDEEVSGRGNRVELAVSDYKRIIDELCEMGLVHVILTGGDPFVKAGIWEIIDYLYQKELAFDIYTNGQKLFDKVDKLACFYPHLVGLSIYSGESNSHDAITRVDGSWNKSIRLLEKLAEYSIITNIKCCIMQPNLHSYYSVKDLAEKYGAEVQYEVNITDSNDGDICARDLRLTEEQLSVVLMDRNISLFVGEGGRGYDIKQRNMDVKGCGAGDYSFCISPEGNLQPCCAFPMVLGNLKKQSVMGCITKNAILEEWRSCTLRDYEECGTHEYCVCCNLCSGQGYIEHGDYKKAAEGCCYLAKIRYGLNEKIRKGIDPLDGQSFQTALSRLPIKKEKLKRKYNNGINDASLPRL
jgi:MoaA/NifB/PqqE/SkfB family radical SAM enzyme